MDNYKQLYEKDNEEYKGFYPLTDILSIIDKESGKNLKQLLNQYNHIKLDWKGNTVDTRNSVPLILRHKGLFVTYDNGTSIITEFYKGEDISVSINSIWQNDNNWTDLSPGASLADNEDIAEIDGKFKFADRNYNQAQFTGMGRVILRKNLADVGGGTVENVLTQDMINKSNTIYEIRYDFDLNGEEITIPEDCVLDFQGGSFSNGIIVGNNTIIQAPLISIFYPNIEINGSWNTTKSHPEWFGAEGDGNNDDTNAIISAINVSSHVIFNKIYKITNKIHIAKPIILEGAKDSLIINDTYTNKVDYLFSISGTKNVIIKNINFDSQRKSRGSIICYAVDGITIEGCSATGYSADYSYYQADSQFRITGCNNALVSNCKFYNNGDQYGTSLETLNRCLGIEQTENANILSCIFDNVNQGIVIGSKTYIKISKCHFKNYKDNAIYNVGAVKCIIDDNIIENAPDEGIVTLGGSCIITNNIITNIGNKCIAIAGDQEHLIAENNIITIDSSYESTATSGFNPLVTRNTEYTIKDLVFVNNICKTESDFKYLNYCIQLGIVNNLVFTGNSILGHFTSDIGANCIQLSQVENAIFSNNIFTQKNTGINIFWITGTIQNFIESSNTMIGTGRLCYNETKGHFLYKRKKVSSLTPTTGAFYAIDDNPISDDLLGGENSICIEHVGGSNKYINLWAKSKEGWILLCKGSINNNLSGNTSNRPKFISEGVQYFDTTLNKPIWWTGTKWVDATGADV